MDPKVESISKYHPLNAINEAVILSEQHKKTKCCERDERPFISRTQKCEAARRLDAF